MLVPLVSRIVTGPRVLSPPLVDTGFELKGTRASGRAPGDGFTLGEGDGEGEGEGEGDGDGLMGGEGANGTVTGCCAMD